MCFNLLFPSFGSSKLKKKPNNFEAIVKSEFLLILQSKAYNCSKPECFLHFIIIVSRVYSYTYFS